MTHAPSDIEIYLLKADPQAVKDWLSSSVGPVEEVAETDIGFKWRCEDMDILFTPRAEGNFDCLWIKQNHTPWGSDLECARSAHNVLNTEIRCAAEEWSESESNDNPGWIKLTRGQEKPFDWQ